MPDTKGSVRRIVVTEFFGRRSRGLIAAMGISLFAIISILKFVSGPDVVFSAIYLVPIVFTTWCLSVSAGLVMAAASTLTLLSTNLSETHKYVHPKSALAKLTCLSRALAPKSRNWRSHLVW